MASRTGEIVSDTSIACPSRLEPHCLEVIDAFAAPEPCQDLVFFGLTIRRDEHPNRLADELGGRVSKHAFRGRIAGLDDAVQILGDDRIVCRIDDGGEICLRALRLLPIANISLRPPHPVQAPVDDDAGHAVREVLDVALGVSLFGFDV